MFKSGQTLLKWVFTVLLLFVWIIPAWGVVYKWRDESGRMHFTDDITKMPPQHRPHFTNKKSQPRKKIEEPEDKNPKKTTPAPGLAKKQRLSRQAQEHKAQSEIYEEQENARTRMMHRAMGN